MKKIILFLWKDTGGALQFSIAYIALGIYFSQRKPIIPFWIIDTQFVGYSLFVLFLITIAHGICRAIYDGNPTPQHLRAKKISFLAQKSGLGIMFIMFIIALTTLLKGI